MVDASSTACSSRQQGWAVYDSDNMAEDARTVLINTISWGVIVADVVSSVRPAKACWHGLTPWAVTTIVVVLPLTSTIDALCCSAQPPAGSAESTMTADAEIIPARRQTLARISGANG